MQRIIATFALVALLLSCAAPRRVAPAPNEPVQDVFPSIPEVRSVHGVAKVVLYVVLDPVSGFPAFEYAAALGIAPTIRVHPGDTIDLTLHNDMRAYAGRADDVNVHFHGLTVSPDPPGDDVMMTLAHPRQTVHYRVVIPADHEPGLYWYHPHAHGESYYDVTNGMAGAVIVEKLQEHLPALDTMLELVARDGVPLDVYPGTAPVERVRHLLLPPAARAEFVVTAPAHSTVLRCACVDSGRGGDADPAVVLADLLDPATLFGGTPSALPDAHGQPLRVGAPLPRNLLSRPLPKPAVRRIVRFTEDARGFYIDGRAFRMGEPPAIVARSGTVEEWTIVNATDELHDFHIHQIHFVTESADGVQVERRSWVDTVNVPRQHHRNGKTIPGRVRLLMDFRDPVVRGTFVYHCHILDHEDQGMMATIRVI